MTPIWARMGCTLGFYREERRFRKRGKKSQAAMESSRLFLPGMPPAEEHFQQHESGAQHDRRIGEVERVPVVASQVKIDKVGNAAPQHAVEPISRPSAKDQRQPPLPEGSPAAARD